MEENKKHRQHCCRYLTLLQLTKHKICAVLSLPTVNAATLYQRITPPLDETSDESQEKTSEENQFDTEGGGDTDQDIDTMPKSELQLEIEKYALLDAQMTGWGRLKQVYGKDYRYTPVEYTDLLVTSFIALALGAIYGGVPALYLGKKRYIEKSGAIPYETRFHAVSESYNAANRGLVRYGFRWGWRVAFVATSFQFLSQAVSWYRNKADIVNYGIAGGAVGAMYRFNLGLRGMVGGSVAGLVVGLPAGLSLLAMQKLQGESNLERSRRMRAEYMVEYQKNIGSSIELQDDAIEYMDKKLKDLEQRNKDTKR